MGMIRKATAFSTLGAVNHRSPRERVAHAAQVEAKASRKTARAQSKLAKAETRLIDAEREAMES